MWQKDEVAELAENTFFGKPVLIEHLHGNLHGNLHTPPDFNAATTGGYPAVLLLHGFGGNRHEHNGLFIKAASALAMAGMVALRVDFRGAGETGGNTREMTINTQLQDARDAFDHLRNYSFVNKQACALLGFSFGGLTAALLAAEKEDLAALALWAPVHDMLATIKRLYGHLSIRAVRARGYMQAGMMEIGPAFFDALETLHVNQTVASANAPILIIQGVEDSVVPVDTAYQWKRSFTSASVEINLIQQADHAFTHDIWAWNAIERTTAWLKQTLSQHGRQAL
jgi:uncharacterized protein